MVQVSNCIGSSKGVVHGSQGIDLLDNEDTLKNERIPKKDNHLFARTV